MRSSSNVCGWSSHARPVGRVCQPRVCSSASTHSDSEACRSLSPWLVLHSRWFIYRLLELRADLEDLWLRHYALRLKPPIGIRRVVWLARLGVKLGAIVASAALLAPNIADMDTCLLANHL